jgi:hypothetical protein
VQNFRESSVEMLEKVLPAFQAASTRVLDGSYELSRHLAVYHEDKPSATQQFVLRAGIAAGLLGFVAGVVLPVLWTTAPRGLYAWIPALLYFAFAAIGTVLLWRAKLG